MSAIGPYGDLVKRLAAFEMAHPGTSLGASRSENPSSLVIRIVGILDTANSPAFQIAVSDCLGEAKESGGLILDLGGLAYASSAGVGALTTILIETQRHGIPFFLCRIPQNVGAILDLLGFSAFFDRIERYEVG